MCLAEPWMGCTLLLTSFRYGPEPWYWSHRREFHPHQTLLTLTKPFWLFSCVRHNNIYTGIKCNDMNHRNRKLVKEGESVLCLPVEIPTGWNALQVSLHKLCKEWCSRGHPDYRNSSSPLLQRNVFIFNFNLLYLSLLQYFFSYKNQKRIFIYLIKSNCETLETKQRIFSYINRLQWQLHTLVVIRIL